MATIAATSMQGAEVAIQLDTIRAYLVGVIAITGGTGLSASLLEF